MRLQRTAVTLLLCLALLNTACPKKTDTIFWTEQVVGAGEEVITILDANGVNTDRAKQFTYYGRQALIAIKADDGTALGHVEQCITLLTAVANDAKVIKDRVKRTLALAILGIANRYLHNLADQLPKGITTASARAVGNFAKQKKWRCRDSVSGQFRKMEYCKANPATTTVETY